MGGSTVHSFGLTLLFYQIAALVNIGVEGLSFGWRVSLGLQLIPACCLIIGSPLIPESPR